MHVEPTCTIFESVNPESILTFRKVLAVLLRGELDAVVDHLFFKLSFEVSNVGLKRDTQQHMSFSMDTFSGGWING